MRRFIITDIHGSEKYLDIALAKMEKLGIQKLIILGDILYHGPRNELPEGYNPKGVSAKLNAMKSNILAIGGNCEAPVDRMVLDFPLFAETIIQFGNKSFLLTHGDALDELDFDGPVLCGHHHKSVIEDDILYLGSLSLPKDGKRAYMIQDDDYLIAYDLDSDQEIYRYNLR